MTPLGGAALVLWLALAAASAAVWRWPQPRRTRPAQIGVVAGEMVVSGAVAAAAASTPALAVPWAWLAVGAGCLAALLGGGAVTVSVLSLADASSRQGGTRVQRTVLRGGAWIGALERVALFASLLADWPDGIVAIVAVKAFARYPELKTGQATGAIERFIIGTFTSLGWAALCAGVTMLLL